MFLRMLVVVVCCLTAVAADGQGDPGADFRALVAEDWSNRLTEDPLLACDLGDREAASRLPRVGLADHRRRHEQRQSIMERLKAIDVSALGREDRVNYEIFGRLKRDEAYEYEFRAHLMPITNRSGFHVSFPQLPQRTRFNDGADYESYIARLEAFGNYADENIELLRTGVETGFVLPAIVLAGYEGAIDPHIVDDPEESLLFRPFTEFPDGIDADARRRLTAAGRQAIRESVVPGYRRLSRFMAEEYVPAARVDVAARALPDGKAFYAHRVRRFTTLDVTPQDVHDRGRSEVARIRTEMLAIIERVCFECGF